MIALYISGAFIDKESMKFLSTINYSCLNIIQDMLLSKKYR